MAKPTARPRKTMYFPTDLRTFRLLLGKAIAAQGPLFNGVAYEAGDTDYEGGGVFGALWDAFQGAESWLPHPSTMDSFWKRLDGLMGGPREERFTSLKEATLAVYDQEMCLEDMVHDMIAEARNWLNYAPGDRGIKLPIDELTKRIDWTMLQPPQKCDLCGARKLVRCDGTPLKFVNPLNAEADLVARPAGWFDLFCVKCQDRVFEDGRQPIKTKKELLRAEREVRGHLKRYGAKKTYEEMYGLGPHYVAPKSYDVEALGRNVLSSWIHEQAVEIAERFVKMAMRLPLLPELRKHKSRPKAV